MDPYQVIQRPRNTEKGHMARENGNIYIFQVCKDATKDDIRAAVEHIWAVNVVSVKTMNMPGKPKRFRQKQGRTQAWKKALVRLQADQAIDALR